MSWNHIRGHDQWIEAFNRVVQRGRLAHSYLFVGPDGVGKKLFAAELGKALLCESNSGATSGRLQACDRCVSCGQIGAGTHPDFILVGRPEESNELPVEVLRELCRNFSLKSARGRGKVAILDDADDLNAESANCFLKTLEEPPPRSLFLLIGSSRDRQLPTILSRCHVVRFAPLADHTIAELLTQHGVTDEQVISRLQRMAGGSPGQAMALADPELWSFRQELLKRLCRVPIDPVDAGKLWMQHVEKAGKEMALQRRSARNTLRLILEFLRDALAYSLEKELESGARPDIEILQTFVARRSPERLIELMERTLDAEGQIRRYIQLSLVLEGLVDAFCD